MSDRQYDSQFPLGRRWSVPDTPRWQRALWIVGGLLVFGLVIYWAVHHFQQSTRGGHIGAGNSVPVGVAKAASGDVRVLVDALGAVTPLATVTVHPQVTGYLNRFDITEGQMVKAGQVLAEIDPRPFQAALDQAKGQLARDQASLTNARVDLDRYQALYKENAVSQQVLRTQVATVGNDAGTVETDKAAVEAAAINLGFCRITSPVDGRVGLRQVDPGNLVVSGGATTVIVVTELEPISILFPLPEDSIDTIMRHVNAGEKLSVTAYDRSMTTKLGDGTLSNVDNQIDPTTGMVKMRAMFNNADLSLFPAQFVNVRLLLDTLHGQTYVPAAAVQQGAQGPYVYTVDKDRTANMQAVTLGPTDGDKVAIKTGVKPGQMVVVDGTDRLKDGDTVLLPGDKPLATSTSGTGSPANGSHRTGKGRHGHHHHGQADGNGQGGGQ